MGSEKCPICGARLSLEPVCGTFLWVCPAGPHYETWASTNTNTPINPLASAAIAGKDGGG